MTKKIRIFAANQSGATVIEYALICALIVLVIITSMTLLGNSVKTSYNDTADKVTKATSLTE